MSSEFTAVASAVAPSNRQRLFLRYFTAILIDLVVLGLFAQYWDRVHVETFSVALLAALVLQVLLKVTLAIEHWVAGLFEGLESGGAKTLRILSAWLILFGSKFVILDALQLAFGHDIHFEGRLHGVLPLIVVLVVMLLAEEAVVRFYRWLGD